MALVLWLGLGRKPEESPEVEEGERDGAALLGVLRGLLEVEQLRAGSCGTAGWLLTSNKNGGQWTVTLKQCLPLCSPHWGAPSFLLVQPLVCAVSLAGG